MVWKSPCSSYIVDHFFSSFQVFAEFVASCLTEVDECCLQSLPDMSLPQKLKYTPSKTIKPKVIKSTKLTKHSISSQGTTTKNSSSEVKQIWLCCDTTYKEVQEIHKHVAKDHQSEINRLTEARLTETSDDCDNSQGGRWAMYMYHSPFFFTSQMQITIE